MIRATIDNKSFIDDTSTLPPNFIDGFKVRIAEELDDDSNYYLKYDSEFKGWKECGLDETRELDNLTMPYIIDKDKVRRNNTITIEPNTWEAATSGDSTSNETPSFVDNKIKDIYLYGSRLGFATDDSLVLSSIAKPDTFYRTTSSQVLESDRVDILLDSSKRGFSAINNVVSFDGELFINTGSAQSALKVNSSFDLTTARLTEVTSYTLGSNKPIPVNSGLYFSVSSIYGTEIYNYVPNNGSYSAANLTKHLPYYIEGAFVNMDYADNVAVLSTDSDKSILYIQNRYSSGEGMLQNAWHKWQLPYDVEYFKFIDNVLYVFMTAVDSNTNTYTFVCSFDLTPQVVTEVDESAYIGWVPFLDIYTYDKSLIEGFDGFIGIDTKYGTLYDSVSEAYDSTEVTQNTLGDESTPTYSSSSPVYYWQIDGNQNKVVFDDGSEIVTGNTEQTYFDYGGYRYYRGDESEDTGYYEVSRSSITTSTFYDEDMLYGIPFTASVTLSEIVPRQQNQDGSFAVLNYATLMLRRMRLYLGNSGVFTVNVDFEDRNDYTVKYTGKPLGKITIGRNSVSDINFRFPINGKSDKVTITITSDSSQPFNLLSAEWQGKFIQRGRSI